MLPFLHASELSPIRRRLADPGSTLRVRNALRMRSLLIATVACVVVAIVLALATTSEFLDAVAITLGGTAFVLLVCAAFLAVGQSEDRARARDAADRGD
jgi:F0F1-type ATP synthase assembly protein I